MKPNFLFFRAGLTILGLATALASLAHAQQQPAQGAFRFVNAGVIPGKAIVTIDSAKLRPDGFAPGENTGMIGILAGSHQFTITHPNGAHANIPVNVNANSFTTVIAYTRPAIDPATKKQVQAFQLVARNDPPRGKGKHFQILSLSSRPTADLVVNGQSLQLGTLREFSADGGSMKIVSAGKPVIDFVAQESGSFLIVIYDRPDGTLGAVLMPDYG